MAAGSLTFRPDSTGLAGDDEVLTDLAGSAGRPLSHAWITDDLVAETRRVWSKHLGRVVTDDEAVEMLVNVRNAALAILSVTRPEEFGWTL